MFRFIEKPHLPKYKVRHIIIGEKYKDRLNDRLLSLDLEPIWMPDNPCVDERLSGHCDLAAVHLGGKWVMLSDYLRGTEFEAKLRLLGANVTFAEAPQSKQYPYDAGLNACILGARVICNPKTLSKELTEYCASSGAELISVRQGYTKCSTCVVDDDAVITSDSIIAKSCANNMIDVLRVTEPNIELSGFDSGFIGGAAFKISGDTLAFTGDIMSAEKEIIEAFLRRKSVTPIYLSSDCAFDIGSAIPLTEICLLR